MHGDPGRQLKRELVGEDTHQPRVAGGNTDLADADAESGPDRRQLRELVVRPQGEAAKARASLCSSGNTTAQAMTSQGAARIG